MTRPDPGTQDRNLPRILCLHGGGVNAEVFRAQSRAIIAGLASHYRLIFVDGPFLSVAHPDIVTVYGDHGPFRRWLRWLRMQPTIDAATGASEVAYNLRRAMQDDDEAGNRGPWVGMLGFSQGATTASSWAFTQQLLTKHFGAEEAEKAMGTRWQFVVLLAGRAPLVVLDERLQKPHGCADPSEAGEDFKGLPEDITGDDHVLDLPTLHVHGLRDPGLEYHRLMRKSYCKEGTTRLVEWDGHHRVPIKSMDVDRVVAQIIEMGKEASQRK